MEAARAPYKVAFMLMAETGMRVGEVVTRYKKTAPQLAAWLELTSPRPSPFSGFLPLTGGGFERPTDSSGSIRRSNDGHGSQRSSRMRPRF